MSNSQDGQEVKVHADGVRGELKLAGARITPKSCRTCRYYAMLPNQECRYDPPTTTPTTNGFVTYFPVLPPDGWCGKHSPVG